MEPEAAVGQGPEVTVTGEVNAPALVTLYSEDGLELQVRSEDVNAWLAHGMRREKYDIHAQHTKLGFLFDSAKGAVATFVGDVTANGVINTAAGESYHVAVVAMRDLGEAWHQLNYDIGQRFGVKQDAEIPTEPVAEQPAPEAQP